MLRQLLENLFDGTTGIAAALASFGVALVLSLLLGRPTINWLIARGVRDGDNKKASETLERLKQGKHRTPTMGGLFIMLAVGLSALLCLDWSWHPAWAVVLAMTGSAGIGAYDDWVKLTRNERDGISPKLKLLLQLSLYSVCGVMVLLTQDSLVRGLLHIPIVGVDLALGWAMVPVAVVVACGASNAVNLSDGLDGLAGGLGVMTFATYAVIALAIGSSASEGAMSLQHEQSATISLIVAGAVTGFLWYNRHPAKVFMGDTGSLALGAGLGFAAIASGQELLLVLIGGVFVAEAASVILQVGYFKLSGGKRIFRCAPLHHHFQFSGWKEKQVVRRFWAAGALCCVLGLGVFGLTPRDAAVLRQDSASSVGEMEAGEVVHGSAVSEYPSPPLMLRR